MVKKLRRVCNYDRNIKLQLLISIYLSVCKEAVRMWGAGASEQRDKEAEEAEEEEWHTPNEKCSLVRRRKDRREEEEEEEEV